MCLTHLRRVPADDATITRWVSSILLLPPIFNLLLTPCLTRFNGATAFRRWKAYDQGGTATGDVKLQWGHRLSAMESGSESRFSSGSGDASMGPPPFGDGKIEPWRTPPSRLAGFNGATAFRRWKANLILEQSPRTYKLQWGHRLSAMERRSLGHRPGHRHVASMGPPPFGDGKV